MSCAKKYTFKDIEVPGSPSWSCIGSMSKQGGTIWS